jgi:pimeloyl-ACP methyl ester carboxylesterase
MRERAMIEMGSRSASRTMLVAFGGRDPRSGRVPPFEFYTMAEKLGVKCLFVRDLRQAWYQLGLPGYGQDIESFAPAVRRVLEKRRVERTVFCGVSAGGYAALVMGTLLPADVVLAFSPQAMLDPEELRRWGDERWLEPLGALAEAGSLDRRWADLGAALRDTATHAKRYQVYFDETHATDRMHAERLVGVPNLRLYRFGGGGHVLVKSLREANALGRIIRQALTGDAPGPSVALAGNSAAQGG